MHAARLLAVLLFAFAAVASPVITSVTPSNGPVEGGTTVVIRGTGFSDNCIICSPPFADPSVYFGSNQALSVTFVDTTTLHAVTPPSIPGPVHVTVSQLDGSDPNFDTLENGFTYDGIVYSAFDPVLFPIFTPPVLGRNGSEFRTTATFWNRSLNTPVTIYGYDRTCTLIDPPIGATTPFLIPPRQSFETYLWPECSQTIGKLFFVPKGDKSLAASLRVYEVSRQGENHGVEIPVVRKEDFDEESIALLDVPTDPKFRLTLRIYGLNQGEVFVNVSFGGRSLQLPLHHSNDPFVPSYTEFTDLKPEPGSPAFPETIRVLVEVPRGPGGVVIPGTPIWAFITVTNNETQHITTITPQQ
ncbi:MAG TPA: IPT/TIG domain-containing protein [Thermoanaerobaculia bacterium]|nr:IPT/TIG domain-containing protein [Thermoanaerobaculia bacterium]